MVNLVYHSVAGGRFEVLGVTWRWVYRTSLELWLSFTPYTPQPKLCYDI